MRLIIPEIFTMAEKASTLTEKQEILLRNQSPAMLDLLKLNFNPFMKMNLPEGEPPFKKETDTPIGYSDVTLYQVARRLYVWVDPNVNITKTRKEQQFIQLLEGIHWTEAELLCKVKDKKLTDMYPSLTEELIRQTFPGLLPEVVVKEESSEKVSSEKAPEKRKRGRPPLKKVLSPAT